MIEQFLHDTQYFISVLGIGHEPVDVYHQVNYGHTCKMCTLWLDHLLSVLIDFDTHLGFDYFIELLEDNVVR